MLTRKLILDITNQKFYQPNICTYTWKLYVDCKWRWLCIFFNSKFCTYLDIISFFFMSFTHYILPQLLIKKTFNWEPMRWKLFCFVYALMTGLIQAKRIRSFGILNSIRADLANRNRREESELQSVRTKYRTGARRNIYHYDSEPDGENSPDSSIFRYRNSRTRLHIPSTYFYRFGSFLNHTLYTVYSP